MQGGEEPGSLEPGAPEPPGTTLHTLARLGDPSWATTQPRTPWSPADPRGPPPEHSKGHSSAPEAPGGTSLVPTRPARRPARDGATGDPRGPPGPAPGPKNRAWRPPGTSRDLQGPPGTTNRGHGPPWTPPWWSLVVPGGRVSFSVGMPVCRNGGV